jgi:DNA polymerase-3 subunit delta'
MHFSDVIGHSKLKAKLANDVVENHLGHAQLFLGKPGHGGLATAMALTQFLLCEDKVGNESCGKCSQCKKVKLIQHPDVHFVFPTVQTLSKTSDGLIEAWREILTESPYFDLPMWTRKIDTKERRAIISVTQSEEIIKKLSYFSYEGGSKVVIIWMPEEMNQQAANKILKILEEPPKKTFFFMVAQSQEQLLQTILSRTQVVNIPRINTDTLIDHLSKATGQGKSSLQTIVGRAEGDLLKAQESLSASDNAELVNGQFIDLMRVCYKKDVLKMLEWAENISSLSKEGQKLFLEYGLHMFRQSLLRNYTEDKLTTTSEDESKFLNNFSTFISGNNIVELLELFDKSHYYILRNANTKIMFTNLCFKVMRLIHQS